MTSIEGHQRRMIKTFTLPRKRKLSQNEKVGSLERSLLLSLSSPLLHQAILYVLDDELQRFPPLLSLTHARHALPNLASFRPPSLLVSPLNLSSTWRQP